jgi:hypothetical protein
VVLEAETWLEVLVPAQGLLYTGVMAAPIKTSSSTSTASGDFQVQVDRTRGRGQRVGDARYVGTTVQGRDWLCYDEDYTPEVWEGYCTAFDAQLNR